MIKLFSTLLFILFFSCNDTPKKFEYIIKDKLFVEEFKHSSNSNIVQLSKGFTYYKLENQKNDLIPIVLVHGFSVPSYIWDPTFELLSSKGYFVIALDLYGRGFSENIDESYTDELFANQVIELLEKLNLDSAKFLGLSNGGRVISKIADINPSIVEELVYVASSGFKYIDELKDKSISDVEASNFIKNNYPTISEGQLLDFKYPEKHTGWDVKYEQLLKYKGFAKALISTRKNHYTMDNIHTKIQNSDIPVYTIWGDSDQVVVFKDFEKRIDSILPKRKEFFILDSGHLPHMENQDDFNDIILSILN